MTRKHFGLLAGTFTIVAVGLVGFPDDSAFADPPVVTANRTVLIVDESGSMGVLTWLGAFLKAAVSELEKADAVPTEFALVLYESDAKPVFFEGRQFGTVEEITGILSSNDRRGGRDEDGYQAIRTALATYGERSPDGLHLLLFTDEDRDPLDPHESFDQLLEDLVSNDAVLDVVVKAAFTCEDGRDAVAMDAANNGYVLVEDASAEDVLEPCENVEAHTVGRDAESTVPDYVELAHGVGGTAWQIQAAKFDGRVRVALQSRRNRTPPDMIAQRAVLAPAFGKTLRRQALERNPPILVALVEVDPDIVSVGDLVTLNGAGSRHIDPDEYIAWSWDLNNDGTEDAWGDVVATSFDTPGDHVVALYVTDQNGNAAHTRVTITVD